MMKFAALSLAALAIALPASAHERGGLGLLTKKPLVEVDAKVQGVAKVDADVLSTSRNKTSVLDLDAKVGNLRAGVDLDISKRRGIDLDVNLGKSNRGGYRGGGYEDCGCAGGVGN